MGINCFVEILGAYFPASFKPFFQFASEMWCHNCLAPAMCHLSNTIKSHMLCPLSHITLCQIEAVVSYFTVTAFSGIAG